MADFHLLLINDCQRKLLKIRRLFYFFLFLCVTLFFWNFLYSLRLVFPLRFIFIFLIFSVCGVDLHEYNIIYLPIFSSFLLLTYTDAISVLYLCTQKLTFFWYFHTRFFSFSRWSFHDNEIILDNCILYFTCGIRCGFIFSPSVRFIRRDTSHNFDVCYTFLMSFHIS